LQERPGTRIPTVNLSAIKLLARWDSLVTKKTHPNRALPWDRVASVERA